MLFKFFFLQSCLIPPNIHQHSTWWPRWYLPLANLLSSICTSLPSSSFSLFSNMVISQTSQQKLSQWTQILSASTNSCFIWDCSRSCHHEYINLRISSEVILLFSNQLPFLVDIFRFCLYPFFCFLHSHLNKSDWTAHLVKLICSSHFGHKGSFAISPIRNGHIRNSQQPTLPILSIFGNI